MRVTKGLFFVLTALVGILALAAPVNAQWCTDPDKVKFRDGLQCVTDLGAKWDELVRDMSILNGKLDNAVSEIGDACSLYLSSDDTCSDPGSASVDDLDFDNAQVATDDAHADLELGLADVEVEAGIISDFLEEVAGLASKVDGAGTDFAFRDRTRTSIARTVQKISQLAQKSLDTLGDEATNTGIAGLLASAEKDLEDASAEEGSDSPDENVAATLLHSALKSVNQAVRNKDRVLSRFLNQVRKELDRLVKLFKIAINGGSRATSVGFVAQSNIQVKVFTLSGQLVSVGAASALSQSSLANGVYVVVYSTGRVEKLVVLH